MKLRILFLALALTGCMTAQTDQVVLTAKKVLTAAHTLHDAVALSASAAARSNACVAACAVRLKDLIDRSETLLVTADGLSDATTITVDVNAAILLIQQAQRGL